MAVQTEDKYVLRLPDGMRDEIKAAAEANGRSMNAEIVARLSGDTRSLRDWFAGQALTAIVARNEPDWMGSFAEDADAAYAVADCMLKARKP